MCFNLHQIREYTHIYRVFHSGTDQTLPASVEVGNGLRLYRFFLMHRHKNVVGQTLLLRYMCVCVYVYIYIYIHNTKSLYHFFPLSTLTVQGSTNISLLEI
jgi:hypothetical protein